MVILVEIDETESQPPQEDRFQELLKEFLDEIKQDGYLNEMTAEMYDQKKFDLIEQLTELSNLHKVLPAQHVGSTDPNALQLVKFCAPHDWTPIHYVVQLKAKRDDSEVGFILLWFLMKKISDLEEEIVGLNKTLENSADIIAKLRLKIEAKESDMQSKQNYISSQKSRLETEKAKVKGLNKQIADLKAVIADNNGTAEALREEVKKKNDEVDTCRSAYILKIVSEKSAYHEEISKLKSTNKRREDISISVIGRLKQELDEKIVNFDALTIETDGVKAQLDTLLAEKNSQDGLIQDLKTRLKTLQAERSGVALSFENVEILTNELKLKLAELEAEVERQRNVI